MECKVIVGDEDDDELEVECLFWRLDVGLYNFQFVDVIFVWLVVEDNGVCIRIKKLLVECDEFFDILKVIFVDQFREMDSIDEKGQDFRDMLGILIEFL